MKKQRNVQRDVKKLMSCLEGDSLLKEIEKSLEQHNKEEQDDFELML